MSSDLAKTTDTARDCAVEGIIAIIGGKWKPISLLQLRHGAKRYSELRRAIPQASERMLVRSLRKLEQDKHIHWQVFPEVPVRVEYSLTDSGESLIPVLQVMSDWSNNQK